MLGASLSALAQVRRRCLAGRLDVGAVAPRRFAALRIAGAVALGRPVTQSIVGPEASRARRAARRYIAAGRGAGACCSPPPRHREPSSPAMSNGHGPSAQTQGQSRIHLRRAGRLLSTAGYGRQIEDDSSALDAALEDGTRAVRRIRTATLWPQPHRAGHCDRSWDSSATTGRSPDRAAHHVGRVDADPVERPAVRAGADGAARLHRAAGDRRAGAVDRGSCGGAGTDAASRCRRSCRSCAVRRWRCCVICRCCCSSPASRSSRSRWPTRTPGSHAKRCRIRAAVSRCWWTARPAW